MKSVIQRKEDRQCYICKNFLGDFSEKSDLEEHHIFEGVANRKLSEKYGLTVHLCHECHNEPPNGAHFSKETADWLHRIGQQAFEVNRHKEGATWEEAREEFRKIFGKNYL